MTQIYAHRGARTKAADNTRAAFDLALDHAIDGIETDVQLSKDDTSVLWHDRYMDKLGYQDIPIDEFTMAQLQVMNFASYFDGAKAESVITLKEFLQTYRPKCKLQIEIKNRAWESPHRHHIKIRQCLDIIGKSENLDIFISSFDLDSLIYAQQISNQIPLVYAFEEHQGFQEAVEVINTHSFLAGLCHPISNLDRQTVDLLHTHKKIMVTYTCNSDAEIRKALDLQVDILITDIPEKALAMRG